MQSNVFKNISVHMKTPKNYVKSMLKIATADITPLTNHKRRCNNNKQ